MAKKRRAPRGYRPPGSRGGGAPGEEMLVQLQQMQEKMEAIQDELSEETVEVSVGGGVVTVVATGQQEIRAITIQPEVVDPDDVDMLQDLVLSAVNQALDASRQLASERMGGLTGGLDVPGGLF